MATGPFDHDSLREMSGLYVLGALSSEDRRAFDAHLRSCPVCADEVRSLQLVSGALAQLPAQVDPPASLRDRVLASVGDPAFGRAVEPGAFPVQRASGYVERLAVAASLLLALAAAGYAVQLRGRVSVLESRLRDATRRADANERQTADLRRTVDDAQSQVAVLAAPDLARVDLAGQPAAPAASARAFWSRARGLVFTGSGLPPLPPGRIYQLWVVTAQAPVSAGLVRPDASGRVDVMFPTPSDIPPPVAIAVTIEPDGGVPAPTGARYLIGTVEL